jgi:hypothetical protein
MMRGNRKRSGRDKLVPPDRPFTLRWPGRNALVASAFRLGKPGRCFASVTATLAFLLFSSCTGGRHFEVVAEGPPHNAPQYVVVTKEPQVATLHFPTGIYRFYAVDDSGFYYRAPDQVLEHTSGSSIPLKGGVYVSKRQPAVVRPFVYRAGALTHVGKLKRGTYEFQNEPSIP